MRGRKSGRQKWEHRTRATNAVDIYPTISIITWNVNGLRAPIKRWRFSKWI